MNGFCPNCEKLSEIELVRKEEEFNIRGEMIMVEAEYYHCLECGEDFENSKTTIDPYETAYREYRSRKGMLQPEDIRTYRIKRGLTQKEFSDLLGIGIATLNRYENGALQSEAHDRAIRMVMEPQNMLNLLMHNPDIMEGPKKQKIIDQLFEEAKLTYLECTKQVFGNYQADLFSGYKKFELEKFREAIKFFCYKDRIHKPKLITLLFYADFSHFRFYNVSITGARYLHLRYGPVPDQFEIFFNALDLESEGIQKEEYWQGDYLIEAYVSNRSLDSYLFSPSEIKVLAAIKERFIKYSPKKVYEISSSEKGYLETEDDKLIPYSYASELSINV